MICKICEDRDSMEHWNICRKCARSVIYHYEEEDE